MTESNEVRFIFIDMNSYFASVEQEINPNLQGKPVAVVPMITQNTCCIAASYEAKAFGVKTGTGLKEAKIRCPQIVFVEARPAVYADFHKRIVEAVESCAQVSKVRSIDEMDCRLTGKDRNPEIAYTIARKIKTAIKEQVGQSLKCSVGVAPNSLLAKIASDMQKPDGLTLITKADLPDALYCLKLQDIPGIGDNMLKRVNAAGIQTVYQLCQLKKVQMKKIWNGIVGERLWHWLQGDDVPEPDTKKSTVGHSHVLPPEFRTRDKAYHVVQKLLMKAALRLRKMNYWAKLLIVFVRYIDRPVWVAKMKLEECRDDITLLKALNLLWASCPNDSPLAVGVSLFNLTPNATLSLFDNPQKTRLLETIDQINAKHGLQTVYFGGLHDVKEAAPTRIGFTNIPDDFW